MKRFVWNFLIATTVFVFANSQLCLAQVEIVDGDGKQVDKNDIPGGVVQQRPATGKLPQDNPQIFGGGNGSSIIIRKSFSSVDENGERKTESSGKAIVIGPDGQRQEFDLGDDQNMKIEIPGFGEMLQIPGMDVDAEPKTATFTLGCRYGSIHPAVASQLGLESGLMVTQVPQGSAAAKAGVQKHDILLFADDKQVISEKDLNAAVQSAGEANANVSLTLIRGGKEISVAVTPEQRKATAFNHARAFPDGWNLDFPNDDLFHQGMEQRMRQQMERMRDRMRLFEDQIRNGM